MAGSRQFGRDEELAGAAMLQGLQIAGLPVPPYTDDEGFGVAR